MGDIASLYGTSVLVVGDVMLDEYVWGVVRRISPEAPVPVVEVRRRTSVPGGAANVAAGVQALGGRAMLAGVVGADLAAATLRQSLELCGVSTGDLVADTSRLTTMKTRVIAHAQQVVRIDYEHTDPFESVVAEALLERVRNRMQMADAVVVSDYNKGVVTDTVARGVIDAASERGKPVIVDPKSLEYAKYRGATVITPNADDAGRAANVRIEREDDMVMTANRLLAVCDGAALLVTRGADGMTLFARGARFDVATRARDVYDVTGAGDTVVAMLGLALGSGLPLEEATELANAAAGIVVGKIGTSTVSLDEVERWLAE